MIKGLLMIAILVFAIRGVVNWVNQDEGKVPGTDMKLFPKET